jgi:hypothetical protein
VTVGAGATAAKFVGLAAGPHSFTVEADYSGGGTSGLSTPSHTITVGVVSYSAAVFRATVPRR